MDLVLSAYIVEDENGTEKPDGTLRSANDLDRDLPMTQSSRMAHSGSTNGLASRLRVDIEDE